MAVTMKDVARIAQVDPSVVSAVLSGSKRIRVSQVKREFITDLAKKMGYRMNLTARALITQKNYAIGILLNSPRDHYYSEMTGELQCQLCERGYTGIFAFGDNFTEMKHAYEHVLSRGVDAILTCYKDEKLFPPDLPVVLYGEYSSQVDSFLPNYAYVLNKSLDYLQELGHEHIGFVGAFPGGERGTLFIKLMAERNLPCPAQNLLDCSAYPLESLDSIDLFLSRPQLPTAIICRNDSLAIAVMSVAGKRGIRIPEDLSIIGIDDIMETKYSNPPLTTNGVSMKHLVSEMLERLFLRIQTPGMPEKQIIFNPELIIRNSCAALSKSKHSRRI